MDLQGYRESFYTYSDKASDVARQLAFAGIAVIWLFKKEVAGQPSIPPDLVLPGIFVVVSLTLDLVQYCTGSLVWRWYYRSKEKAGVSESAKLPRHPLALEWIILLPFIAKLIFLALAYVVIFTFLLRVLLASSAASLCCDTRTRSPLAYAHSSRCSPMRHSRMTLRTCDFPRGAR